jgi:hypothetical protein
VTRVYAYIGPAEIAAQARAINLLEDDGRECANCGAELPGEWNFGPSPGG